MVICEPHRGKRPSPCKHVFSTIYWWRYNIYSEIERLQNEINAKPENGTMVYVLYSVLYAEYVTMLTKGTINPQDLGVFPIN